MNISNDDKADNKIENNGFISISQIETRVYTSTPRKRLKIAYISNSSDEEAAIDINADKNTNQGCDDDGISQFDPNNFRRYLTRIKKPIKKSLPYYSKE